MQDSDRGRHLEVRIGNLALGVEDVQIVRLAECEAERVEVDTSSRGGVHAAHIDRELVVDEDPHVVVSLEAERLAAEVRELDMNLGRVKVVVQGSRPPDGVRALGRHERQSGPDVLVAVVVGRRQARVSIAHAIEREVVKRGEFGDAAADGREGKATLEANVCAGHVRVPLVVERGAGL